MKVEMGKKYTSGGKPVRILCTDRRSETYPIVGMCNNLDIVYFTEDGRCITGEAYDLIEQWEPTLNEWCLFWDDEKPNHAVLAQFIKMYFNETFYCNRGSAWKYCAKFTGELPEHFKGL
jgi:hypothetical protein